MSKLVLQPADFNSSVVAVPPIALTPGFAVAEAANTALVRHIERGGVSILLYGGNANLYHFSLGLYADALAMMVGAAGSATRIITSIGPDFGKMQDQAALVEQSGLRNVMLLPTAFPADSDGVANGARRIADRLGFGVILYLKRDGYVAPETLGRLVADGAVRFVKYAVERPDAAADPYLDAVLAAVGKDVVASGMGETPVADHLGVRKLPTFTSGAVCIAPAAAMRLLTLYKTGRHDEALALSAPFLEFEKVRSRVGGLQVLHDSVTASGIADMGPLMPMVSNVRAEAMPAVREAVQGLIAAEQTAITALQNV
jgi:dihydrodipicolinate synthase/N-acetylneuraminate lyase